MASGFGNALLMRCDWTMQTARNNSVSRFRAGKVSLLVVTDVAARGIDIPLLDNVVHFDFPAKPKLFVHRSGRAARMGRLGTSYALLTRDEVGDASNRALCWHACVFSAVAVLSQQLHTDDQPQEAL